MHEKTLNIIQNEYGIDKAHKLLFKNDHHIVFLVDIKKRPIRFYILSGDPTKVGLPKQTTFDYKTIMRSIQKDNLLAEIESKKTFLKDTMKKLLTIDQETHFYVPFKYQGSMIWLSIGLEIIKESLSNKVILGRVNRISKTTPKSIAYYRMASQDELTNLFTRETLRQHLRNIDDFNTERYGLYVDLDDFKQLNDIHGHRIGDLFLKRLGQSFIDHWERNVLYYRLGGDEFFVYIYDMDKTSVIKKAEWIINHVETLDCEGIAHQVSASIGIASITSENAHYTTLLDVTDQAMYRAKDKGKGCISF